MLDDVRVDIVHNIQTWSFNLSDDDGDGTWTGSIDFQPSGVGQPSFKVIATDGVGDSATVDVLYTPLKVIESSQSGFFSLGFAIGAVAVAVLVALLITLQRRRTAAAEMKIIDSWNTFGDGSIDSEEQDDAPPEDEKLDWDNV